MAQSHQRPFTRRQLAVIGKIAFIEAMALSLIIPTISSTGEIPTTSCNLSCTGPISFDKAIVVNDTTLNPIGVSTLTSTSFTILVNETMIVNAVCYAQCNATLISDTQLNTFHFIAEQRSVPNNDTIDVWWTIPSSGSDLVTVNWSSANYNFFEIALYKNSAGVGTPISKISQSTFSTSITITTSGSWAIGVAGTGNVIGNNFCQAMTTSSSFRIRINSCSFIPTSGPSSGFISDNATALPNSVSISFSVIAVNGGQNCGAMPCLGVEFEILPTDLEPQNPSPFKLNYAGTNTKPNALNQVLAPNTAYCTGLTSNGVTISTIGTSILEAKASYGGVSLNTTGLKLNVAIQISTSPPQTTFGAGCTISANPGTVATIVFQTSGALGASNSYVASLVLQSSQSVVATTTYFASVAIFTVGFTGHANYDQVLNQAYSFGTISLLQVQ